MGIQGSFFDFFCFGMAGYQPVQPEAHACELLIKADRGLYFTIEQPAQSWGLQNKPVSSTSKQWRECVSALFALGFGRVWVKLVGLTMRLYNGNT